MPTLPDRNDLHRVSVDHSVRPLAEALNRVGCRGDRVVLQCDHEDVAALVSLEDLELLERLEDLYDVQRADRALADPANRKPLLWAESREELLES